MTNIRSFNNAFSSITNSMKRTEHSKRCCLNRIRIDSRLKGITLLFRFVHFVTPHLGVQFEQIDNYLKYIIILHKIHSTFVHDS